MCSRAFSSAGPFSTNTAEREAKAHNHEQRIRTPLPAADREDGITGGGLPKGRPTLVCGGPGCGKTLLALKFLVQGATQFDEPGVLMTFEENAEDLAGNVASLGFDLPELITAENSPSTTFASNQRDRGDRRVRPRRAVRPARLRHSTLAPSARPRPSRHSSPASRTTPSCVRNCAGCSGG